MVEHPVKFVVGYTLFMLAFRGYREGAYEPVYVVGLVLMAVGALLVVDLIDRTVERVWFDE